MSLDNFESFFFFFLGGMQNYQREGNVNIFIIISLVRQKNNKEAIVNQEGTRMVKDGGD